MKQVDNRKTAAEIFYAGLKAVDPYDSVKGYAHKIRSDYITGGFNRLLVIGFGKAACPMARALEDTLSDLITAGVVITKYGHNNKEQGTWDKVQGASLSRFLYQGGRGQGVKIKIYEAGHPLPDENGVKATEDIIGLLKSADENTLVACLISGGGSALLVSPNEGILLATKQEITNLLLKAGADIYELNTIRKHISEVKGGQLAKIAYPAKIISLILSDVIGDRLNVIASGPTSPDTTTYSDALKILEKYRLAEKAPESIIEVLREGAEGLLPETPKEGDRIFNNVENIIIGSSRIALDAAKRKAEELGFHAEIISSALAGEARDAGRWLAGKAKGSRGKPVPIPLSGGQGTRVGEQGAGCLISGGETTVTVKGSGVGGRNTELALSFAMEIEGIEGITLLSAGTDGTDGPTDAAGAIVDGETIRKAKAAGMNSEEYLNNNDSYNFFKKIDGLFITGPTGTNVMDVQIVIIDTFPF